MASPLRDAAEQNRNSSPDSLASVSEARRLALSLSATRYSRRSPVVWPE